MAPESHVGELIEQLDQKIAELRQLSARPDFATIILETLESLARQAKIAIQNARLHEDLAKRVQELEALQQVAKAITSTVDLGEDLQKIAAYAVTLIGGDAFSSSVYLYDEDKDEFQPGAAAGEIDVGFLQAHRPRKRGIGREALNKNQPVFTSRLTRINPRMRQSGVRGVVSFPLTTESGPVGLLYVHFRTAHGGGLTDDEERVLSTFADQAATAIQTGQLFRQREEEMALLHDIGVKIQSALKVEDVLKSIVEGAMRLTDTDAGTICLVSDEGVLTQAISVPPGFAQPTPRSAREDGLTFDIISKGQPLVITDTEKDARVDPAVKKQGVKSMVGFPLRLEDMPLGVLYLSAFCSRRFGKHEISLLSFLASQVVAIQRARVYEERLRQLERAQRQVLEHERAATLSSIGGVFAHRIGNLAGYIPDTVRQIRKRVRAEDEYLLTNLKLLERGAERLLAMAESLDKLGTRGPLELVDINGLMELALASVVVPESIRVSRHYASGLPMVKADRSFLLEVFVNLISNALEAMPQGGQLRASSRLAEGRWVEAVMVDTGVGMSQEELERLFTPFYSTRREGGMGLGLWSSRLFARRLGGDIVVESEPGGGSTFTVRLPAAERPKQV